MIESSIQMYIHRVLYFFIFCLIHLCVCVCVPHVKVMSRDQLIVQLRAEMKGTQQTHHRTLEEVRPMMALSFTWWPS